MPETNNDIYDRLADTWWRSDGFLNLLQTAVNPWRLSYFRRILHDLPIDPRRSRALDVGCGGGLLAEEIAAMGFAVTGVDPSRRSLEIARTHAVQSGLQIDYQRGHGHQLAFEDESFDVVFCCDVLEHVRDWDAVIREISRVLRRNGVFCYDTINRTFSSKLRNIFIAQQWRWTRYAPAHLHVWEMFITPDELAASLTRHGLEPRGIVGTAAKGNPIAALRLLRQYKTGRVSAADFGRRLGMTEGPDISNSYVGHAVKP